MKPRMSSLVPAHRWVCRHQPLSTSCTFSPGALSPVFRVSLLYELHIRRRTLELCSRVLSRLAVTWGL